MSSCDAEFEVVDCADNSVLEPLPISKFWSSGGTAEGAASSDTEIVQEGTLFVASDEFAGPLPNEELRHYVVFQISVGAVGRGCRLSRGLYTAGWSTFRKKLPGRQVAGCGVQFKRFKTAAEGLRAASLSFGVETSQVQQFDELATWAIEHAERR